MSATSSAIPSANPTSVPWNIWVDDGQTFNLTDVNGNSEQFTVSDVSQLTYFLISTLAIQGFIVGFSSMLLIVLTILTPLKKAKRPIFICNYAALLLVAFKAITVIGTYCNQFIYGFGEEELGALAQYPASNLTGPDVFAAILSIFIYLLVIPSLILQVRVVFAAEPTTQKTITVVLGAYGLALLGLQIAWQVAGIQDAVNPTNPINLTNNVWTAFHIGFVVFIGVSSLLFLYKLIITIYRRRRMGFKQFGPLQVLVIMFVQCLFIPEAFLIADLFNTPFNGLSALALAFLVCALPLSALWASHESEGTHRARVTTTSSSVTGQSPPSSRFRRFFIKGGSNSKDSRSDNSDLEKASNFSDTKKSPSVEAATLTSST